MPVPRLDEQVAAEGASQVSVPTRAIEGRGHELRRPKADYLRDGIYELRATLRGVNHRVLYFFYGNIAAVVSHGIVRERAVPLRDINRAIERIATL